MGRFLFRRHLLRPLGAAALAAALLGALAWLGPAGWRAGAGALALEALGIAGILASLWLAAGRPTYGQFALVAAGGGLVMSLGLGPVLPFGFWAGAGTWLVTMGPVLLLARRLYRPPGPAPGPGPLPPDR